MSDKAWYASYVKLAAAVGLVEGENGRFRPEDPVTREELALLFARFARRVNLPAPEVDASVLGAYSDAGQLSDWAKADFALAVNLGWVQGVKEDAIDPRGAATRAQTAVMLLRVMGSLGE